MADKLFSVCGGFSFYCRKYGDSAKIVKGECRAKRKRSFQAPAMPSRILSYQKIVKGERRIKYRNSFQIFFIPSRILSYPKIVKGECRAKRKRSFQAPAMPSRILSLQETGDNPQTAPCPTSKKSLAALHGKYRPERR